jgi:hypothetical protein
MTEGSRWFRRFAKDCKRISRHIRLVRIKLGFYRIYWKEAYIGEVYKEMPLKGYDKEEDDIRMIQDQKYYEEFEDGGEVVRKVKNFVEGYWDTLDSLKTRVWLMRNSNEHYESARNAYKQMIIK